MVISSIKVRKLGYGFDAEAAEIAEKKNLTKLALAGVVTGYLFSSNG